MRDALNRARVKGFLHVQDKKLVNGEGEEVLLSGWGLGNWLLCEGYMWRAEGEGRFDRPRRMESVLRELTGDTYAAKFWPRFRERYITKDDIAAMAAQGYNSVRIPFNWRLFLENEPGLHWKEEGFALLDRCIDWCEEYGLYAFLDMHGAPGGQTGANIDDCFDDVPRLYLEDDCWHKALALWRALAERYRDRWIVGGYDLLNEPLAPGKYEYLLPRLCQFYEEAVAAIREVDSRHLFSIEGHHWASNPQVFYKRYDDNMVIHFHRYACLPDLSAFSEWLALSDRLQLPLWLGETGENLPQWFAAMYPLSVSLGVGYNLWPWKKMDCENSPCSVRVPEGWDELMGFVTGGPHPGHSRAQEILEQYLGNMDYSRCDHNDSLRAHLFRTPGCTVRATDFDELPGRGLSYSGTREEAPLYPYRRDTGMAIREEQTLQTLPRRFTFDCRWDRFTLELCPGEFATYTVNDPADGSEVLFTYRSEEPVEVTVWQDDRALGSFTWPAAKPFTAAPPLPLRAAGESHIRLQVTAGSLSLETVQFR